MIGPCLRPIAEVMEDRILHSVDLTPLFLESTAVTASLEQTVPSSLSEATVQRSEIVFVDATVPDVGTLLADLQAQRDAGRLLEIVTIAADQDGLALISATLAGRQDISAVHVLAHGGDGVLQLGSLRLDGQTLLQRAGEVSGWSAALTDDADLLLYGCDLAQTALGQGFVNSLAALTGADVAASQDLTGAAAMGGNWVLEFGTGSIEVAIIISSDGLQTWAGTLVNTAPILDTTKTPVLPAVNENAGAPVGPVGSLVSSLVDYALAAGQVGNFSDIDGDMPGIAITGVIGGGNGTLFYSINNGGNWTAVESSVSNNSAVLLRADTATRLYFQPAASKNGLINHTFTFRAWDGSSGLNGQSGVIVGSGGGSSAFSNDSDTVDVTVNAVNDAPVRLAGSPGAISVLEDSANSTAVTLGLGALNYGPGGGDDELGQVLTYKITAIPAAITLWQADGTTQVSVNATLTLTQLQGLTYKTISNANGVANLTWTVMDNGGTANGGIDTLTENLAITVNPVNDLPVGLPQVNGTPTNGQVLSAFTGGISDADGLGALSYQWLRDGAVVAGATSTSYLLGGSDVNTRLSVQVSYTDGFGALESVTSEQTAVVSPTNQAATGSVAISGTAEQGQTLSASNTLSDADGLGVITYRWLADGVDTGVTGVNYLLAQGDVGKVISVKATFTDGGNTAENVTSLGTAVVANINDAPAGLPSISGTGEQGQTLSASNTLSDADGLGIITYSWYADGASTGVSGASYLLAQGDVGRVITVQASYTDAFGVLEQVTSAGLTIANVDDAASGTLSVSGVAEEGGTLVASLSGVSDPDGATTIAYRWQENIAGSWSDIAGAGSASLAIPGDQSYVGKNVRVLATSTDALGGSTVFASAGQVTTNVDDAPVLASPISDKSVTAGTSLRFLLAPATFTDPDVGDSLHYSAGLVDGSALPAWLRFDAQTLEFFGTPKDGDAGNTLVRVIATDDAGATAQAVFAITVIALPVPAVVRAPVEVVLTTTEPAVVAPQSEAKPTATPAPAPVAERAPPELVVLTAVVQPIENATPVEFVLDTPARFRGTEIVSVLPVALTTKADTVLVAALLPQFGEIALSPMTQLLQDNDLMRKLDEMKRQMSVLGEEKHALLASSIALTSGLSIGYVVWLVRGGVLLSSMLSALPAWQMIDPLPVLAAAGAGKRKSKKEGSEDRELERLFDEKAPPKRSETSQPKQVEKKPGAHEVHT